MLLSLLVVNYNTETYISKLLQSLSAQSLDKAYFEIIIVNNSQNDILDNILTANGFFDSYNIRLYDSGGNLGFGKAMNIAFDYANGNHVLLINPDVQMLQDFYLERLIKYALDNPNYGAISTQILDDNHNDVSTYYSYEFGRTMGFDGDICWFQGSLLLIRSEIFKKLMGFDVDFFMYCEDVDLCYRIKKMGLKLLKIDELKVYHFGGASEPNHDYDYYHRYLTSQILFAYKHYAEEFTPLLERLYHKSKKRVAYYQFSSKFVPSHRRLLMKNQAMYDVTTQAMQDIDKLKHRW
ncbi:glycosyltransferase family 2 protein [Moraxella canis]|uniref:glycosyltransferase family 2 protein n=1 Tax=Moraxella canis TaxID=90239 RepID=UPI0006665BFA|nr:glycosyltransferase family 2 protein [Moraxella canis]